MSEAKDIPELEYLEHNPSQAGEGFEVIEARAKEQQESEHALRPLQAIKYYPMAIFWSLMVSMCVIMEGYDTIL